MEVIEMSKETIAQIIAFGGNPLSNLKYLVLSDGIVFLDGNYALKAIQDAFGSLQGAIGKLIQYSIDSSRILEGFTPLEVV